VSRVAVVAALLALAVLLWPRSRGAGSDAVAAVEVLTSEVAAEVVAAVQAVATSDARADRRSATRRAWDRRLRLRRDRGPSADDEVLELLDALGPALRAGLPPSDALRAVSSADAADPVGLGSDLRTGPAPGPTIGPPLLSALVRAADEGTDLSTVWRREAEVRRSSDLALVASAWSLCERLGSPLAATVTTVSAVVRDRRAVRRRMDVALAGPRASMTVLTALPAVGPLLALVMGVSPADLYASAAGTASLAAGLALLAFGRWWGARLVRGVGLEPNRRER
jgi:tight adherence protein B